MIEKKSIVLEASVTLSIEEISKAVRPSNVPEGAALALYRTEAVHLGDQREPYLAGVKFVWRWEK